MAFLIIPLVFFVISVGAIYIFRPGSRMFETHRGTLRDLRFLLEFLTKTNRKEALLRISVQRRVTCMEIAIEGDNFVATIPLLTSLQRSREKSYIDICNDLGLQGKLENDDEGDAALCCRIDVNEAISTGVLSKFFGLVFEVKPERKVDFKTWGFRSDHEYLYDALSTGWSATNLICDKPGAFQREVISNDNLFRYYNLASGIFLRPVILIGSFLSFGFLGFSLAVMGYSIFVFASKLCFQVKRKWKNFIVSTSLLLLFVALSNVREDPGLFQLYPSALAAWFVVREVASAIRSEQREIGKIYLWAGVVVGVATIITNELLRANVSFETWIWVYSFAGFELVAGFFMTVISITSIEHVWDYFAKKAKRSRLQSPPQTR